MSLNFREDPGHLDGMFKFREGVLFIFFYFIFLENDNIWTQKEVQLKIRTDKEDIWW